MLLEQMDKKKLTKKTTFRILFTINLRYEIRQDLVSNLIVRYTFLLEVKVDFTKSIFALV